MGGESSKQSGSSEATHNRERERKRSGLSSVLAGVGRCSISKSTRSYNSCVPPGSIPEHIPSAPVKCTPVPILQTATLGTAFTWIPDTEAALIMEWNRERQAAAAASTRGPRQRPNWEVNVGGWRDQSAGDPTDHSFPTQNRISDRSPTPATGDQAGCGATSSAASVGNLIPLNCDCTPVLTGRSTGLIFSCPTTWTQLALQGSASFPPQSSPTPSNPKAPADGSDELKKPGSGDSPDSPVVISELPVGIDYYYALQARWTTPESCSMPPATEEEDLNDSIILEAVADPDGSVLSPPVPLGYMIDLFVPQWRAEGLFDQAELGNQTR
ncbi:hypothetical protein ABL78_6432 [Leptomonas seymouri]|uniref:Uncharacterized protein n=1 Tax=Leptomonas seymouri TaxID=5684 RepID=A0A0N1PBU5_LEPSE|nr:hypothetical protein ABL78_6432 [Leptomonas seymouri]|eukprot:KPI84522.1 hypothetical protein ABL78_6432 [Leptomonas seymouri]